jgi:Polysaccharide lyase
MTWTGPLRPARSAGLVGVSRRVALTSTAAVLAQPVCGVSYAQAVSRPGWRAVASNDRVTIGNVNYEAECGPDTTAIQRGANDVVRFTMIPGNGWKKDNPKASERTELDGWPSALPITKPIWCAWSMQVERGATSTSDWCILQQLFQVQGYPIVHVLKPDGVLRWVAADAAKSGGAFPVRYQTKLEPGTWLNFVETLNLDPTPGQGYWRCWLNGQQVLDFKATLGTDRVTHCYAKFGIYRGVMETWDGVDPAKAIKPVKETLSARYCNMRFSHMDLSRLIAAPEPIPAWQAW